jgi:hypothetical protein
MYNMSRVLGTEHMICFRYLANVVLYAMKVKGPTEFVSTNNIAYYLTKYIYIWNFIIYF